ncbi:MAG: hypothetical protein U9P10_13105 [Thermodesulfobacteriota bacterium]|nr:hypothetical protein [Thermodesulfobacteriota bacterium]
MTSTKPGLNQYDKRPVPGNVEFDTQWSSYNNSTGLKTDLTGI